LNLHLKAEKAKMQSKLVLEGTFFKRKPKNYGLL
jgi:hypothetical protein